MSPPDLNVIRAEKEGQGRAASKAAMKQILNNLPDFIEYLQFDARLRLEKYRALVGAGFTETQALEICKGSIT